MSWSDIWVQSRLIKPTKNSLLAIVLPQYWTRKKDITEYCVELDEVCMMYVTEYY